MDQHAPAPSLSVNLTMTAQDYADLANQSSTLDMVRGYIVDSPEMADAANAELRSVKGSIKLFEEKKRAFVAPARQIIAEAEALFDPALKALGEAESLLKSRLLTYVQEQERKALEAKRAAEEEARKAAQKAAAEAAAIRAKAEEQARAARRLEEEAEARRLKAIAEGNAAEAARAAAEAAKAAEKAAAVQENAEAKANEVQMVAAASAPVAAPAAKAPAGFSMRDNWICELAPGMTEEKAVAAIASESAKRPELLTLLKLDMTTAGKLAKALKTAFNVPGLVAKNAPVAASRSK